ncbi:MAG: hypothetical protein S4CHLAM123_00160 [Chlamydiales bacterium]|nr:hypothetical protein [Chlamydiales bacterium]
MFENTLDNMVMSYGLGNGKLQALEELCNNATVYVSWWGSRRVTVNEYNGSVSLDKLACAFSSFLESKRLSDEEIYKDLITVCEVSTDISTKDSQLVRTKTDTKYTTESRGYAKIKKLYTQEVNLSRISKIFMVIRSILPFQAATPFSYLNDGTVLFHKNFNFKFKYS